MYICANNIVQLCLVAIRKPGGHRKLKAIHHQLPFCTVTTSTNQILMLTRYGSNPVIGKNWLTYLCINVFICTCTKASNILKNEQIICSLTRKNLESISDFRSDDFRSWFWAFPQTLCSINEEPKGCHDSFDSSSYGWTRNQMIKSLVWSRSWFVPFWFLGFLLV